MFGGIPNHEIDFLEQYWTAFPQLRSVLFAADETPYSRLAVENIKEAIEGSADVQAFVAAHQSAFADFDTYLDGELIGKMMDLNVSKAEDTITQNSFGRVAPLPLIDKYQAYQLLDDKWNIISTDLEIIQTEGFAATKQVDPNMVIKKKDDKDEEVQNGWVGHVIPFDLVQTTLLREDYDALKAKEARLDEISAELAEMIASIDEGDGGEFMIDDFTAYMKTLREAYSFPEDSFEAKMVCADKLMTEEKAVKKDVKEKSYALHMKTKETIEGLSDEQVLDLLRLKWIVPLCASLRAMPDAIIDTLEKAVQALADKYAVTYLELDEQIQKSEEALSSMIDELTGNEYDMKGLAEFKALLKGDANE